MGFFKDFKDDFSQALNELLPGDDFTEEDIKRIIDGLFYRRPRETPVLV